MRYSLLTLMLICQPVAGQALVVSSGGQSIVVSSHADRQPVVAIPSPPPTKQQTPKPITITLPELPAAPTAVITPPVVSKMSHDDMVAEHNRLHGGGNWSWPGDLATHLEMAHGVQTATPVVIQRQLVTRVQSSCPGGVCPANRTVQRSPRGKRGFLFWRR